MLNIYIFLFSNNNFQPPAQLPVHLGIKNDHQGSNLKLYCLPIAAHHNGTQWTCSWLVVGGLIVNSLFQLVLGQTLINQSGHQCLSQDLETGCLKLAVGKFLGIQIFKEDHNILIFQQ